MKHYYGQAQSQLGVALPNVTVTVYLASTLTLAQLYTDDGITLGGNPLVTDSNGRYNFYTSDGRYDIAYTGGTIVPFTESNIEVADLTQAQPGDAQWETNSLEAGVIELVEVVSGSIAPIGSINLYAKTDNHLYYQDQFGNETGPLTPGTPTFPQIKTVSTGYSTTAFDGTILVNATVAPITITLTSSVAMAGQSYTVKKIDSSMNAVTVVSTTGNLDGVASFVNQISFQSNTFQFDGTNWWIT
jgi:hypothetical protein